MTKFVNQDFTQPLDEEERKGELAYLTDPKQLRDRRFFAEKKAAQWGIDEYKKLRLLAKSNPFFLAYTVLGYTKLSPNLHGDVCNWIKDTEADRFRLLLLPRGHYKSTIYTITDSIRAALPDDSNSYIWPYCLGPDIRVCLMHEVAGVASKFLSEIQNHFLSNEFLMALFPECIPDPRKHTVNMQQLQLPRTKFWKEKTFECMGVGGRSQGNHYNILKPDDLMGKEAKDSKIILQSTKDWIDNLQSFLTSFEDPDHIDWTGTHWGFEDIYFHIQDVYQDQLKVYKRAVEEKGERISPPDVPEDRAIYKMNSIFPEQYPAHRLEILKKNRDVFDAQYMNDPSAGGGKINWQQIRFYYWRNKDSFVAFDQRTGGNVVTYKTELEKMILLDPALTGNLGIVVTGTDKFGRTFVLDCVKEVFKTKVLIEKVFQMHLKWNARTLVVESVLFSALYEEIFELHQQKRGMRFRIVAQPVHRKQDKVDRIVNSLSSYFEDGILFLNETQKELLTEIKRLGFTENVHMVDALSMGPKNWRPYNGYNSNPTGQSNYSVVGERNPLTGYTPD